MSRRIGLDLGLQAQDMSERGGTTADSRRQPAGLEQQVAFERALSQRPGLRPPQDLGTQPAESTPGPAAGLPRPKALPAGLCAELSTLNRQLADALDKTARRLLVSEEGESQVLIELEDSILPGVFVRVSEQEARLMVTFICQDDLAREQLYRLAGRLAQALADSLSRQVLVQVCTDDDEDPRLLEVEGHAGG